MAERSSRSDDLLTCRVQSPAPQAEEMRLGEKALEAGQGSTRSLEYTIPRVGIGVQGQGTQMIRIIESTLAGIKEK